MMAEELSPRERERENREKSMMGGIRVGGRGRAGTQY